ncbi:hypothetical protein C8R46DRAFT_1302833 [Mycena filopes]|nr:hypothetical protein C8R46DRAFT_1302833 [Mycena filopes]
MSRKSMKRKAKELEEATDGHITFHNPNVKRLQYTVTSDAGSSMTTSNAQLLEDFGDNFEELGSLLLDYEADDLVGTPCQCGREGMVAQTQCHDCTDYQTSCSGCFVSTHLQNPFHWAEVWDTAQGFFVRHDISKLGHIIQLGHGGGPCPSPVGERLFTVVDSNGVHSTRLAFCGCYENPPNKIKQLMRARLFPATTRDPHSAFSINMLKQFQLHNLESKKAAYDYLAAIRRLSDNSFTADVANPYAAFLRVVRVFNFLTLKKRTGQFHGIDCVLCHRPSGNLLVWCPACPEPGFNSDPNCPQTPHHLRHLNQSQRTLDGNFQCNQFNKNTDPDDVSLCAGKGYFPLDSEYKSYLAGIPVSKEAVNKQDKRKFKNMAVTGTVNCQCSHVFILSCVDLHYGERFCNTDKALAMELERHQPNESFEFKLQIEVDDIDQVTTASRSTSQRWSRGSSGCDGGVPALHVQGHQDSCTYLFGTAYMECVGHFHGESAEQYWPESNQLGPHVRQMNNGHRQDTMIFHHGDWNYKKTMQIASSLAEDLQDAKKKYLEKRNHFIGLSLSFSARLQSWKELPRITSKVGKEAKMLNDHGSFAGTTISNTKVASFLEEGLRIQDLQRTLRNLVQDTNDHDLVSRRKEIALRTSKAQTRIDNWRKTQKLLTPLLADKVAAQSLKAPPLQDEKLFLPSDFSTPEERQKLGMASLAEEEVRWREGQAFDSLRAIQNIVKTISALRGRKIKNDRQQKQNTRAGDNIEEATTLRNRHMALYEVARQALLALNAPMVYPLLTEADLYMKPVLQKRRVGDSRHTDGALFRMQPTIPLEEEDNSGPSNVNGKKIINSRSHALSQSCIVAVLSSTASGTQMEKRKAGDRVQWFRAEAEMQRWQEQAEQKLAELLRTNRSFLAMETAWTRLAEGPAGHRAYALQKAAMYRQRAETAQGLITGLGYGDLLAAGASVVRRVQAEREAEEKLVKKAIEGNTK